MIELPMMSTTVLLKFVIEVLLLPPIFGRRILKLFSFALGGETGLSAACDGVCQEERLEAVEDRLETDELMLEDIFIFGGAGCRGRDCIIP